MAAESTQPVSCSNLAASLGVDASGGTGGKPVSVDNMKAVLDALGATVLYDGPNAAYVTLSDSLRDFDCFALVMQYSQSGVNTAILAGAAGAADAYAWTLCGSYVNTDQPVYATFNFNISAKTIQSTTSWRIRQVIGIRL